MSQQLAGSPVGGSTCAALCLELLCSETVACLERNRGGVSPEVALEAVGMRAGQQYVERLTRDRAGLLGDTLACMKLVCKELWSSVWNKQVDNLRTNHKGVYVLHDSAFKWLLRFAPPASVPGGSSSSSQEEEALRQLAAAQVHLPRGIIRGALCHLGVPCTVEAELKQLPACTFTVRIQEQ